MRYPGRRALTTLAAAAIVVSLSAGCWPFDGGAKAPSAGQGAPPPVASAGPTATPPSPPPKPSPTGGSLAGTWSGQWANQTPDQSTGGFTLTWTQKGSTLSGSITITGTPCLSGGSITGSISGSTITFGAVNGQVSVGYNGTVSGSSMAGTYATDCGNARGTWTASRK